MRQYIRDFFIRCIANAAAISCLVLVFFLIASFVSYNPQDPSINVASDEVVSNVMGDYGSCASDMLFQFFGISALLIPCAGLCLFYSLAKYHRAPVSALLFLPSMPIMSFLQSKLFPSIGGPLPNAAAEIIDAHLSEMPYISETLACITFVFSAAVTVHKLAPYIRSKLDKLKAIKKRKTQTNGRISKLLRANKPESSENSTYTPKQTIQAVQLQNKSAYKLPYLELLEQHKNNKKQPIDKKSLSDQTAQLLGVLSDFGIHGDIINAHAGPVVTLFELQPTAGIKASRIISLSDDIARSMSAFSARVAPIPGKNVIGIELSNQHKETVYLSDIIASSEYNFFNGNLALVLGKDISGYPVIADLARMPHLLVAGTTGSGKSVGINSMILSLLYRLSPSQCRLIMIDPKMLELSVYDDIPHLLTPVVTDPKKAVMTLKWVVHEMENRYRMMSQLGVRNIEGFNQKVSSSLSKNEKLKRKIQTGFDPHTGAPIFEDQELNLEELPFIVVVVDEMADLMLVAGKEIEIVVQRLAQMARAAGIHLIMATQRPSVDVITGTIKANFPTRISFQVTSKIDSRTILGEQGAEQLLGHGDMLYMASGGRIMRVHGPFVSDSEIERVVTFLKQQGSPEYIETILHEEEQDTQANDIQFGQDSSSIYKQAVEIVKRDQKVSTSYIQRQLQIGYNRAARIIEQMEKEGLISPPNHVGKREILF
ncbi:FtsK/SpoIIIE family DNA translocase [Candidatus Hydrogenosomobacter endosymbioticus]|nr:DNA translocase FtsK 4TM domain-containing protein [Candidatus Hydrogenosomobacter endosymbioticus]